LGLKNRCRKRQKWYKSFEINGFIGVANDEKQRAKMAKSGFLSPVRLPFRHSGNMGGILAKVPGRRKQRVRAS
jgi:hypothetical protein